jgi:hypothetical protein
MRFRAILWVAVFASWLLLVDTTAPAELIAGAFAASLAAWAGGLALAGAGARPARSPHPAALLGACARQFARVPVDLWLLTRELVRALAGNHRPGRFHTVALPDSRAAGQAAREIIGSLSPNTIVIGIAEDGLLVHQLVERAASRRGLGEVGR